MRCITIADLHLNFWKAFSSGHGPSNSRFLRTLTVVRDSLDRAKMLGCPWICAGDWSHTIGWTHNTVLTQLISLLKEYPEVEKYTVWGNHDARSQGGEIHWDETVVAVLTAAVPQLHLLLPAVSYTAQNGMKIYGEGYQPDRKYLHIGDIAPDQFHVGVFHQSILGSKLPSGLSIHNTVSGLGVEELYDRFRLSIVGDIHQPQAWCDTIRQRVVLVPGSPEYHNFGDAGTHGWWECQIDDTGTRAIQFPSGSPEFITVPTANDVKGDGNFYRVLHPDPLAILPENAIAIVPPPTQVQQRRLESTSVEDVLHAWLKAEPPPVEEWAWEWDKYFQTGKDLLAEHGVSNIRPVEIQKVKMRGFCCFADEEFPLQPGITLVTGESRDFESNGAGKTSLFEAIFWCLFGRTTKGLSGDDIIQYGQHECEVAVEIEGKDEKIVAWRGRVRNQGGDFKIISIPGGEQENRVWGGSPAESTKELQRHLGITPELFQALAYFSQSRLLLFSQATDSERKTMLTDLCGLSVYQNAATDARERCRKIEDDLRLKEQQVATQKEQVAGYQELVANGKARMEERRLQDEVAINRLTYEIEDLQRELPQVDVLEEIEITKVRLKAEPVFEAIKGTEKAEKERLLQQFKTDMTGVRDQYELRISGYPPQAHKGVPFWSEEYDQLVVLRQDRITVQNQRIRTEATLRAEMEGTKARLEQARDLKDSCPTCGQSITAAMHFEHVAALGLLLKMQADAHQAAVVELEKAGAEVGQLTRSLQTAAKTLSAARELEVDLRERDTKLNYLQTQLEKVDDLAARSVQAALDHYQADLDQALHHIAIEMAEKRATNKQRQSTAADEIARLRGPHPHGLDPLEALITKTELMIGSLEQDVAETEAEIGRDRVETQVLAYWARGFSRSGIQSVLLEGVAAAFNEIRPQIFPLLTRGIYDVQFSTTSTTAEGEAREKTEFIIRDRDALVTYESLSGGQRRRIDLGVMLTLAMAVAKTRAINGVLGILVLDEVFGFLDSDGVEALYETLQEVQSVIPHIYAITHDPDLKALFQQSLLVRQDEYGISHLIPQAPTYG